MIKRKGFSLFEILIVLGIISLSIAVSYPIFSRFSAKLTLSTSAKSVITELRALQAKAVSRHKTLELGPSQIKLPAGIKIISSNTLRFSPSGYAPPGGSGTWVLENRLGDQKKIIVTTFGRMRIE